MIPRLPPTMQRWVSCRLVAIQAVVSWYSLLLSCPPQPARAERSRPYWT